MASKLKTAVASKDAHGTAELGKLVTYSMTDDFIPGTKLVRCWAKHGLDPTDLPDVRSGLHNFQSACRSVETRRRNGAGVEVKVDEVVNNNTECVYQVTRMVRDKTLKVIEHPKAMTVAFDKKLETITVRELEDYNTLRQLEDAIRTHFQKNAKAIPGQKIRNSVRSTLLKVGAQNLRRKAGGLYFVPHQYSVAGPAGGTKMADTQPTLDGLAGVFEELYGHRGDFWTMPLLDSADAQKMVAKHFAINVAAASEDLLLEAVNRVRAGKGRGVQPQLRTRLWNERRKLGGQIEQFSKMVALERADIEQNLRDLDKALAELDDLADSE
jgi:hypothetical protein